MENLDLTALGLAALVVILLIREVIAPLINILRPKPNGLPAITDRVHEHIIDALERLEGHTSALDARLTAMEGKLGDVHTWHAPDSSGSQDWKGGRIAALVERQLTVMAELGAAIRDSRQVMLNLTEVVGHLRGQQALAENPCAPAKQ